MCALWLHVQRASLIRKRYLFKNETLNFCFILGSSVESGDTSLEVPTKLHFESAVSRSDRWGHQGSSGVWINQFEPLWRALNGMQMLQYTGTVCSFYCAIVFQIAVTEQRREFCKSHPRRSMLSAHHVVSLEDGEYRAAQDHTGCAAKPVLTSVSGRDPSGCQGSKNVAVAL